MAEPDLVIITLAGVQRFINESRTTADLRAASQIIAHLAAEAVERLTLIQGTEIVFPAPGDDRSSVAQPFDGAPNRVVVLVPAGTGPQVARKVRGELIQVWEGWVKKVFDRNENPPTPSPGWPVVQWVSVPASEGGYATQWDQAVRLLAERKNTRDFEQPGDTPGELCTLSPRWRAVERDALPTNPPGHLRRERLAVTNWVKRLWHRTCVGRRASFPSTNAIASLPYRHAVLKLWWEKPEISTLVGDLREAAKALGVDPITEIPTPGLPEEPKGASADWLRERGSRWVFTESWHVDALAREFTDTPAQAEEKRLDPGFVSTVRAGWKAAEALERVVTDRGEPAPSPHLAVLVQDLDFMGLYLSGKISGRNGSRLDLSQGHTVHTEVSARLFGTAGDQRTAVERAGGVVVYAGGDDLLALVPAVSALETARACRAAIAPGLPHASSGVLFFHHGSSLRQALARAQELLEEAKALREKNGLGIGFIRGSGSHAECVLSWSGKHEDGQSGGSPVDALNLFLSHERHPRVRLSPRLLPDLLAEQVHLDGGGERAPGGYEPLCYQVAQAEMRRLVHRHTSLVPAPTGGRDGGDATPQKSDREERKDFAAEATRALELMSPRRRLVDEGAVRVALFLRQEVQ